MAIGQRQPEGEGLCFPVPACPMGWVSDNYTQDHPQPLDGNVQTMNARVKKNEETWWCGVLQYHCVVSFINKQLLNNNINKLYFTSKVA